MILDKTQPTLKLNLDKVRAEVLDELDQNYNLEPSRAQQCASLVTVFRLYNYFFLEFRLHNKREVEASNKRALRYFAKLFSNQDRPSLSKNVKSFIVQAIISALRSGRAFVVDYNDKDVALDLVSNSDGTASLQETTIKKLNKSKISCLLGWYDQEGECLYIQTQIDVSIILSNISDPGLKEELSDNKRGFWERMKAEYVIKTEKKGCTVRRHCGGSENLVSCYAILMNLKREFQNHHDHFEFDRM